MSWLLDAYIELQKNIILIPVSIQYERVFEQINFASEMISGTSQLMSFWEVLYKVLNYEDGQLGNVFVKFLDPINLKEFIGDKKFEPPPL